MKTKILQFVVAFCFLGLLPVKTVALNYTITFTGTGASSTVDSVIVQNLTKGTKVTVPAGNVLNLSDVSTAVDPLSANDETIRIYPVSAVGKSILSFYSKQAGNTQLNVFSCDGRKITGISTDLQAGTNTFELSLPKGVFVIQVTGNEYAYTAKMLNQTGLHGKPGIVYTGTEKPVSSSPQKTKSSNLGITTMAYTTGDQLLYKATSGTYIASVSDVPTGSKTINFVFDQVITPTSIELNKATLSLVVDGREKLLIIVTPTNATVSNAKWSSSDQSVATVDENGIISALTSGNTTITLTVGSTSKQCALEVVKSPITGLIMPEFKYPIAAGATIMLLGTGFTAGDKIWLRKNDNSAASVKSGNLNTTSLKSAHSNGDILTTIMEQAQTYISFASSASDGWYSVILDNDTTQYNLGNIQIVTAVIPEFAYDKTKIFWEDTHWRRLQLRGNVKEMTITPSNNYNKLDNGKAIWKFNQIGHLESFVSFRSGLISEDSIIYKYDEKNRLTNISHYLLNTNGAKSLLSETWEYTYGNHELYLPVTLGLNNNYSCYWGNIYYFDDWTIWVKGLIAAKYESYDINNIKDTLPFVITDQIDAYSDSIVDTQLFPNGVANYIKIKTIYTYNGVFPKSSKCLFFNVDPEYNYYSTQTFQFSSTGMPVQTSNDFGTFSNVTPVYTHYSENAPYYLVSKDQIWKTVNEYDSNWNLSKYLFDGYTYLCNYVSYDKTGNWTVCNVGADYGGDNKPGAWTVTRDITYW